MKAISNGFPASRILLFGLAVLLMLGVFFPQCVKARMHFERAMPATEGDPTDGWDYSGGSGGSYIPPEEDQSQFSGTIKYWSLDDLQIIHGSQSIGVGLMPYFNGQFISWQLLFIDDLSQGGKR